MFVFYIFSRSVIWAALLLAKNLFLQFDLCFGLSYNGISFHTVSVGGQNMQDAGSAE